MTQKQCKIKIFFNLCHCCQGYEITVNVTINGLSDTFGDVPYVT